MGAGFAERFNRTIRDLLKRPVFEEGERNWNDILPVITKQHNNRILSSTKLTPIQASSEKSERYEGYVYKNSLDRRKKVKPKFQVNNLAGVADLKRTFSKGDTTNWSYKLFKNTKIVEDTKPGYKIDILRERYNEALLKKTDISINENNKVTKYLNNIQFMSK